MRAKDIKQELSKHYNIDENLYCEAWNITGGFKYIIYAGICIDKIELDSKEQLIASLIDTKTFGNIKIYTRTDNEDRPFIERPAVIEAIDNYKRDIDIRTLTERQTSGTERLERELEQLTGLRVNIMTENKRARLERYEQLNKMNSFKAPIY